MSKLMQIRTEVSEPVCSKRHIYLMIRHGQLEAVGWGPRALRTTRASLDNDLLG